MYFVEGVEGRDVVDVGGSVGETAILYKINGARKVVSVEPLNLPSFYKEEILEEEVPTFTLSDILSDDPYMLKMDCEGCEYDVILKDYETVKRFTIINFHNHERETGISHRVLINKLRYDYEVKVYNGPGPYQGTILVKKKH